MTACEVLQEAISKCYLLVGTGILDYHGGFVDVGRTPVRDTVNTHSLLLPC